MPYCINPALSALATEICRGHGTGEDNLKGVTDDDHETLLKELTMYKPISSICLLSFTLLHLQLPNLLTLGLVSKLCCTKFDRGNISGVQCFSHQVIHCSKYDMHSVY